LGSVGGGHDDQAEEHQGQVGEQGVVGQKVDPGDDDPVEEVEQDALKGWTARWSMAPLTPWRTMTSPVSWRAYRMARR
jgi:hypothetical protein